MKNHYFFGFTLIEVLVVLAIIGILAVYILASLGEAKRKTRDVVRTTNIREILTSLNLYFESNKTYPTGQPVCDPGNNQYFGLEVLYPNYISSVPTDPLGGTCYVYATPTGGLLDSQLTFHVGASLEERTHKAFDADFDCFSSAAGSALKGQCAGVVNPNPAFTGGHPFDGFSEGRCWGQHMGVYCYDRTPD